MASTTPNNTSGRLVELTTRIRSRLTAGDLPGVFAALTELDTAANKAAREESAVAVDARLREILLSSLDGIQR